MFQTTDVLIAALEYGLNDLTVVSIIPYSTCFYISVSLYYCIFLFKKYPYALQFANDRYLISF